ncbi:hypothetical protein [Faucicola atlantae]|uniref:hypothetical protein n=1 Tax=Faucicola atlantae TaxID=34059 RepID=UPI0025B25C42|nr:hypothetical protein [Moraxella atlantae]
MSKPLNSRADYTFKYNSKLGRHGWLRLTPAYSVKLVDELLVSANKDQRILDPFSGTATTGVVAAEKGFVADLFDINPFLIWLGNIKCQNYNNEEIENLKINVIPAIKQDFLNLKDEVNWQPNIFNIERWWCGNTLPLLNALRASILKNCGEPNGIHAKNLIWVAFMRLIIETSSAAFNHVSMSFKGSVTTFEISKLMSIYDEILENILNDSTSQLIGRAKIWHIDSKEPFSPENNKYDKVITSPPYPNRMTYIRELRPYMYWSGFLEEAREAGELDWQAIGGTWGIATSRLKTWTNDESNLPHELFDIVEKIRLSGDKNSEVLAQYVFKYFVDMHKHLARLRPMLNNGATLDYIIGNSSFYGNLVEAETLFEKSFTLLGYSDVKSKIIRKRNSNKNLFEFCVSAKWIE